MKNETNKLLSKAADCLEDAHFGLRHERLNVAVNRAYYAMFDAVQAILQENDIFTKTHQGANIKFNEFFVKTGLIEKEIGKYLNQVFDMRQSGDYDMDCELGLDDAAFAVDCAEKFLAAVRKYLD